MWEGVGDQTELQHIDPDSYGHQSFFPILQGAQPEAWGPTQLGADFLYHILSPTGLVSKLTDFLSSPSYMIVQSPTQYLWNGMFDRHQAEIIVMQFTGYSFLVHLWLYDGILPCPILSAKPAYAISSHNCHWNVSLPQSLEWHVWPGRRSIYKLMLNNINNSESHCQIFCNQVLSLVDYTN